MRVRASSMVQDVNLKERTLKFGGDAEKLFEQLCDVGEKRIAETEGRIKMPVLSFTPPGTEQVEATDAVALAREANDFLADSVYKNPSRLAGFAALPIATPDRAAEELEQMVRKHGFKGAIINGHSKGATRGANASRDVGRGACAHASRVHDRQEDHSCRRQKRGWIGSFFAPLPTGVKWPQGLR